MQRRFTERIVIDIWFNKRVVQKMRPSPILFLFTLLSVVAIDSHCRADDPARFRKYEQYALQHSGDAEKGKELFQNKRTKCAACHTIDGKGGQVGVDLSQIGGKFDRPHLIESLLEPSRQIVEGYRTANILTTDGKVVSGIMKLQNEKRVTIVDAAAQEHVVLRADMQRITYSTVSIMPEGLAGELSQGEFTDLIAYLESLRAGLKAKMGSGVTGPISLPKGFKLETVVTGLDGATALDVLPDGRVLVCEQPGRVRMIEDGKLCKAPVVTLPVDAHWERGVIGVTHDPEFPAKPYIYVCWVAKQPYPHHHVSRFTLKGNVAVDGSEKLLLVGDDQTKMGGKVPAGHQGGALHFGIDGKLYIGIGEQTAGAPAQQLDTFLGKILRINPDGTIPDDNPFVDRTRGKYRAIWAHGCRNPFTFAIRKADGLMFINDVGGKSEEINIGRSGANYGWPVVEHGDMPEYRSDQYDGPVHWYKQSSVNGGDFCPTDRNWPQPWRGRYFFADFVQGWIHALDPDNPGDVNTFVEGVRRPVDLRFAPDGSLYVLLRNAWVMDGKFAGGTGSLLRIWPPPEVPSAAAANKQHDRVVLIRDAIDDSADDLPAFKIETPLATYYLEKSGGGLSSLVDRDGNDWLGFHPRKGSGAGGEFRGFPNAVFRQGGNYFHARNAQTDEMRVRVERDEDDYVSILAESVDRKWQGRYEFFATHCTFSITKMPRGKKYWVLYEGTPGGALDRTDWWMTSNVPAPQPIDRRHDGDIASPQWIAFGDSDGHRSIVLLCHTDDPYPDSYYQMHEKMTVFGFGRQKLEAFHSMPGKRFSIGLVENHTHAAISEFAEQVKAIKAPVGPKPGDRIRYRIDEKSGLKKQ